MPRSALGWRMYHVQYVLSVFSPCFRITVTVRTVIRIRCHGMVHTEAVGHVELPGVVRVECQPGGVASVIAIAQR
jgi:hypothetical protein